MGNKLPYLSLNHYLKQKFGERVQKIPLDAGLSCPNRDGSKGRTGCIYCDPKGSGTGLAAKGMSVSEQMHQGIEWAKKRYNARKFIAYFQSFSNTYGPLELLERLYLQSLQGPEVVGVAIGTRPDCIDRERLKLIAKIFKDKMIWIELGLQSANNHTLNLINRGHTVEQFEKAVHLIKEFNFSICAHVIFGLPEETKQDMEETINYINSLPIDGIKFHQLYILENVPIFRLYQKGQIKPMSQTEYANMVAWAIKQLRPNMVIQRLTGDPPRHGLAAPVWSREKHKTIELIHEFLNKN